MSSLYFFSLNSLPFSSAFFDVLVAVLLGLLEVLLELLLLLGDRLLPLLELVAVLDLVLGVLATGFEITHQTIDLSESVEGPVDHWLAARWPGL